MCIKLICIDMDGTLLKDKNEIAEIDKQAIISAGLKGVHVALTTGRVFDSAKLFGEMMNLKTPIIASNGAYIGGSDGEVIYKNPLSIEEAKDFITVTQKYNLLAYFNAKFGIISTSELPETHIYKQLNKTLRPNQQIRLEVIQNLDDIYFNFADDLLKGVCVEKVRKDVLLKAKEELKALDPNLEIVSSWDDNFEMMKKGSSKGDAVKRLATYFGLTANEVMCIGDSENDISMIKFAGIGVAMGNALQDVKEVATFVTDTNKQGGVAKAIHKFVLDVK